MLLSKCIDGQIHLAYTTSMQGKPVALQVRLPEDLHAEIRRLSEDEDRPLNRTIIRLLRAGLEAQRRQPREQVDQ